MANAKRLLAWFALHARDLPWRRTRNPYAVWVSEIMLQQTQVKTVIPYWERWMKELPTLTALAEAPMEKLLKLWEGLGYYRRVRHMQKAALAILRGHQGKFPTAWNEILELPGIGRYTAGAICSIAYNTPVPVLDGNVIRVLTRVYGIADNPTKATVREGLWQLAQALVGAAAGIGDSANPPVSRACGSLNESLMELGALICTPRSPLCTKCPLRKACFAFRHDLVEQLPKLPPTPATTRRTTTSFVVERNGQFLVRRREQRVVNGELWEFPRAERQSRGATLSKLARATVGTNVRDVRPLCSFQHSITRYRISAKAYRGTVAKKTGVPGRWLPLPEISKLPLTSADGKILRALLRAG